eukprot:2239299-Amphidinium_carterae.1
MLIVELVEVVSNASETSLGKQSWPLDRRKASSDQALQASQAWQYSPGQVSYNPIPTLSGYISTPIYFRYS